MKRLMMPAVLVLVVALGSYAIFAQQPSLPQGGSEGLMSGGTGGGMMDGMSCGGCAMMHTAVAATSDGGVIVAAAGKLIKYDAALKKVSEVEIDIDWNAASQKMQQNCPMTQMMQ